MKYLPHGSFKPFVNEVTSQLSCNESQSYLKKAAISRQTIKARWLTPPSSVYTCISSRHTKEQETGWE
jgi:hypothetical protein